ncbi:MAG: DMT family transporter [Proteobacteria bacterium]|nr:DMT family transporter [Pseudomonadota bacterium]MCL2310806.1 DMT family transporter [Pseudomonadota bacterium]
MLPSSRLTAYAVLVITSAMWGSNAVIARDLLNTLSPTTLAAFRWVVATSALIPFVWNERGSIYRALRTQLPLMLLLAIAGFAPNTWVSYLGLQGTTAIFVGLMNSIVPVMVVLIMAVWKRRRPRWLENVGLTLSFVGVLTVLVHGEFRHLLELRISGYDFLALLGLVIWAFYTVLLLLRPRYLSLPAFVFTAGVLGLALIVPMLIGEWWVKGVPSFSAREIALATYIGLVPTLIAMLLFGYGVAQVGPVQAGIFTHLVPIFAALFATLFIHESLYIYHGVGFVLVAGGAVLCCLKPEQVLLSSSGKPR